MLRKSLTRTISITVLLAVVLTSCGGAEGRKAKYLERGKAFFSEQNYDKASVELRNVIQIDPKNAEAYYIFGQIEEKKHNYKQAFDYYLKSLELNPDNLALRSSLGRFYLASGNIAKAQEMANAILAKQPNDPDAKLLNAGILSRQGNDTGAIKLASELLSNNPANVGASELLAAVYAKQEKYDAAIEVLQKERGS